jgi:hypothetical protein
MNFEIVGEIQEIEIIATGKSIRERARLNKVYGIGPLAETERDRPCSASKWQNSADGIALVRSPWYW